MFQYVSVPLDLVLFATGSSASVTLVAAALYGGCAALLWFGLGFYLLMLGLIAEVALRQDRGRNGSRLPMAREGGP